MSMRRWRLAAHAIERCDGFVPGEVGLRCRQTLRHRRVRTPLPRTQYTMKPRQTHSRWRLLLTSAVLLPATALAQVAPTSSSTTPPRGGAGSTSGTASGSAGQQDETI